MIGRTRKSPRSYSGRFSSITSPISTPDGGQLAALLLGQGRDHLAEPLHRRLARELADHVRLGGRDRHLRADRPAPWETQGNTWTPRNRTATAPSV